MSLDPLVIREERPADAPGVRRLHESAFGQPGEADLVDTLRASCSNVLSLVALDGDKVVGHVLFSPVTVSGTTVAGMGLAPVAVLPGWQGRGIGSRLVRRGLAALRERGCPFVVVLGHPEYYPRFGFVPASARGLLSQWEGVPDGAFFVLVLDEGVMRGARGVVRYRPEFDAVS